MIDIEAEVIDKVYNRLKVTYDDIYVSGGYVSAPPSFPAVTIMEIDNTPLVRSQTSSESENHSTITYEINTYSNKSPGTKFASKAIVAKVDEIMTQMGFYRIFLSPMPNEDSSVFRYLARYRGVVSSDHKVYRR